VAKKIEVKVFDDLRKSLQDALAFEQGREVNLRATEVLSRPRKQRTERILARADKRRKGRNRPEL
jgi:hypothetical protein